MSKSTIWMLAYVFKAPTRPPIGPASSLAVTPGPTSWSGTLSAGSVPYTGSANLCLEGRLIQIWKPCCLALASDAPPSACSTPEPVVIHCMPGASNVSRFPRESPCRPVPTRIYVHTD